MNDLPPRDRPPSRRLTVRAHRVPRGERRALRRIPLVAFVIACLAGAALFDQERDYSGATATATAAVAVGGPSVPAAGAASASWYCAEGTSEAQGRADETIYVANVGDTDAQALITVLPAGEKRRPAARSIHVPKRGQRRVQVSDILDTPEQLDESGTILGPGVVVEAFGGRVVVEHAIAVANDVAVGPCARQAADDWYFAAGNTERGSQQFLSLLNPFPDDAIVDIAILTDAGLDEPADLQGLVVPRRVRLTVPVHNFARRRDRIAVHVHARSGRVVAEQSLRFGQDNETRRGVTLSLGAVSLSGSWTFGGATAEGGASSIVMVANFDPAGTEVEVAPRIEGDTRVEPRTVAVPGRSVVPVDLATLVTAGQAYAVQVRTTQPTPVVAEELAAWAAPSTQTGAAASIGAPVAAKRWAFAAGRLDPEGDGLISVFNPGRKPVTVSLLRYESGRLDRPASAPEQAVRPGHRALFDLRDEQVDPDQTVVVTAERPVVAEREIVGPQGASIAPGIPDLEAPNP